MTMEVQVCQNMGGPTERPAPELCYFYVPQKKNCVYILLPERIYFLIPEPLII